MWKEDLCQIQDLDTGYPSADVCVISCSWKYIIHKYISCPIKYTQFPEHRHSQQGSPPKPLSASELPCRSLHSGGRKTKALGRCESFHLQLDVKAGQTSCTLRCLLVSGVCACLLCAEILHGWWGWRIQIPTSGSANVRVWFRECKKASCYVFLWVCACVLHPSSDAWFYFHPIVLGYCPTASGTCQSWQTNIILSKAAEGSQATTAQEWWLSACGKPEVFTRMEQLDETPSQKTFQQEDGAALPTAPRKLEPTWGVSVLHSHPFALQSSSHSWML